MPSRSIIPSFALALLVAAWPLSSALASVTPADSTTAATPAPDEPAAAAPADSVKDATKEAQEELKEAKEEAKDAIKEEARKEENKADATKAGAKKAEKNAKKAKAKAAAAAKGTAKSMEAGAKSSTMPVKPATAPQRVQVQHILIGFTGSVPGKAISRSKEEARKLAYELLERARKGESFEELVAKYTDDSPPGIYGMCEKGLQPAAGEYPRDGMVAAFGNVGFNISPGNIGIADYDPSSSPFGWHIIKRLK
jgi:parvulin-like peptidyl-prolyl cis-trans isomerase-like protein